MNVQLVMETSGNGDICSCRGSFRTLPNISDPRFAKVVNVSKVLTIFEKRSISISDVLSGSDCASIVIMDFCLPSPKTTDLSRFATHNYENITIKSHLKTALKLKRSNPTHMQSFLTLRFQYT